MEPEQTCNLHEGQALLRSPMNKGPWVSCMTMCRSVVVDVALCFPGYGGKCTGIEMTDLLRVKAHQSTFSLCNLKWYMLTHLPCLEYPTLTSWGSLLDLRVSAQLFSSSLKPFRLFPPVEFINYSPLHLQQQRPLCLLS